MIYNSAFSERNEIKVIAFDLDGTLTNHRTPLEKENRKMLERLSEKYKLLIVGAGTCERIFRQMERFPIDIIGNYGLQYAEYRKETGDIVLIEQKQVPCDRESVSARAEKLRRETGFTSYAGESVEIHPSGSVTIPCLGTDAKIEDKLVFDPKRERRRKYYEYVCGLYSEYTVFIGGSSSYDMVPRPYDKYYALCEYCRRYPDIGHKNIVFVGDDYGDGGNDNAVFVSDIPFLGTENYRETAKLLENF